MRWNGCKRSIMVQGIRLLALTAFLGSAASGVAAAADTVLYGVADAGVSDSQFFKIVNSGTAQLIGPLYIDYDFEAMDISPITKKLYVISGGDSPEAGALFEVDKSTGALTFIGYTGATGVNEIVSASFDPLGVLWAFQERIGLVTIDLGTASMTLQWIASGTGGNRNWEGLAWDLSGRYLYGAEDSNLYRWDPVTRTSGHPFCPAALPLPTEALEIRPDGVLFGGSHFGTPTGLRVFSIDPSTCTVGASGYDIPLTDIESLAFEEIPSEVNIKITKFTNGHDGDNANGIPSANPGSFDVGTSSVAEVEPGDPIIWTYRVTNTGEDALENLSVTDSRGVAVSCPKTTLAVGESIDCTATGVAQLLAQGGGNVDGCDAFGAGAARNTYENVGTVTAVGQTTSKMVDASNPSHYCNPPPPPKCALELNKSCEIVQPAGSGFATCKGKIQKFTLIWPSNQPAVTISGIANNAPGGVVDPGQRVTFMGPWTTNDLFLNISGGLIGRSTFHVSCSDKDMDGITLTNLSQQQLPGKAQDCGKFEGDGKALLTGFINSWLLEGLVDAEGKVLNCNPQPTTPTNSCSFEAKNPPSCGTGGSFKPSTLTFKYTGGGCSTQSNSQAAGKTSCNGQIDPTKPVDVAFPGGTATSVLPGGTFTMPRTQTQSLITLSNSGGVESDSIHTSCSQPLKVGDVYFSLTLVAEDGVGSDTQVKYSYKVTNTGSSTVSDIMVVDDKLGALPGSPIAFLAPGATATLTATTVIGQTTTNVATATALPSCPAPGVQATATVTVQVPAMCAVTQTFVRVEDNKYVVKLTNNGSKVVTLDTLVLNWPASATYQSIKEVKLDGSIYKADLSNLVVTSGVPITASDWTLANVTKRQLDPGETRTLEISFLKKWPKANCPGGSCFSGTASFAEGCQVGLTH